ncbi:hypothetical protein, partial [Oceaniglobus roseus]|uniref:hypothetical protein n=1 Tax=Oceaniglobus roseus TaxID=1737570 RepID=UPI001C12AA31
MPCSRARLLASAAIVLMPLAAPAQTAAPGGPSLWDLLKPEYLVQRALQGGVMALRSQMDVVYGAMSVDIGLGQVSMTDITLWPLLPYDPDDQCKITIERLTLRVAPLDRPDLIRLKTQAQGVEAPADCLPPEPRQALPMAGLENLAVPRLTVDLEYDIASASADLHAYARVEGAAAVDLTGDIGYLAVDAREPETPKPVVYLRGAALTVENLGLWEATKGMLPAPFTDPAQAPAILEGLVASALADMNRPAPQPDGTDPAPAAPDSGLLPPEAPGPGFGAAPAAPAPTAPSAPP